MTAKIKCAASLTAVLLLVSCGKQYKAESVVKGFMKENYATDDYALNIIKVDSTRHISDSVITAMKVAAVKNKCFKQGIKFGDNTTPDNLIFVRTQVIRAKDTVEQTFYLDSQIDHVVAFK